jgi:cell division protein FtsQ
MLNSVIRSQRRFLRKCDFVITTALFLALVLYSSLDKIIDRFNYCSTWCKERISSLLLRSIFSIAKIVVTGNKLTNEKDILNLVNITQPIMYVSLLKLIDIIKYVSRWIKHVRVHRMLPRLLRIALAFSPKRSLETPLGKLAEILLLHTLQRPLCIQHDLPWRRRPETLSRVNYKL